MADVDALACGLSGPDLAQRLAEWADVGARAQSRHVEKHRVVSTYPKDGRLLLQVRKLIAAEADCCPFMAFTIEERPDHFLVELQVPDQMSGALDLMLSLVTNPGRSATA